LEFHHQIWLGYDVGKFPWVTMLVNSTTSLRVSFVVSLILRLAPHRCRVGGGAQSSGLASVRRSNPACGSPALGFHNSMLFSIVPTKVSVIPGLLILTRRIVSFQAMFSNHSTANVCSAVTRSVAQSIGLDG
jgi:hypothetical protein